MSIPTELKYTKDHEWISATEGVASIGVTSYAIEQLGDIVHIELPDVGESIEQGDSFGTIESTKTVSDLYSPAKGEIVEINENVVENPETLQDEAFGDNWLLKLKISETPPDLMTAESYEKFIEED